MATPKKSKVNRVKSQNPALAYVRRLYNKSATMLIGEAVVFAVSALIMLFWPVRFLATLTWIIGIVIGLFGLHRALIGLVGDGRPGTSRGLDITFGLVNVLIGVLCLSHRHDDRILLRFCRIVYGACNNGIAVCD